VLPVNWLGDAVWVDGVRVRVPPVGVPDAVSEASLGLRVMLVSDGVTVPEWDGETVNDAVWLGREGVSVCVGVWENVWVPVRVELVVSENVRGDGVKVWECVPVPVRVSETVREVLGERVLLIL